MISKNPSEAATLAIFSPSEKAYSETFIQAHRLLPFRVKYFYDGYIPSQLEGTGNLQRFTLLQRIQKKIGKHLSMREWALLNELKREIPDCVLAEYGPTGVESLPVLKHLNIRLIVHFHGYDASVHAILEKYRSGYQKLFAYACKVIVVSRKMEEALLAMGCLPEKLVLSPYGPDPGYLQLNPEYSKICFVAVGRFIAKKAPTHTLNAFAKVVARHPGAMLVMVGEGELLEDCRTLCIQLGLDKQVSFPGVCSKEKIQQLFKTSLGFVQHSVTAADGDSEGTPVAILEAQAAGLPVIATRHAGIPDVVLHNETGLLVEEGDIDGMAENMLRLINEAGLAKQMGQEGRLRISRHFTMEQHLATVAGCIESCINSITIIKQKGKQRVL